MAKALIAAVLLALVLVAAVVVPMVLTPGVYGFNDWPKAKVHSPRHEFVSLERPPTKPVATAEPAQRRSPLPAPRAPIPHHELAQAPRAKPPAAPPAPPENEQPQAAPEAPVPAPPVSARDDSLAAPAAVVGEVEAVVGIDGTNQP